MDDSKKICEDLASAIKGEIYCDEVHRIIGQGLGDDLRSDSRRIAHSDSDHRLQ